MNMTAGLGISESFPDASEAKIISGAIEHAQVHMYQPADVLPFHNVDHMEFVFKRAMLYCDYVESHGRSVDRFAIGLAAILHDIFYDEPVDAANQRLISEAQSGGQTPQPFRNKEEHSAWESDLFLINVGLSKPVYSAVNGLIRVTAVDATPITLEEKILVRSDLDNVSGPSQLFIANTLKLVKEAEILDGPKNPYERIAFLHGILWQYASKDLCFGDFDKDIYDKTFRKPAVANIARIADNNIRTTLKLLGEHALKILPSIGGEA